MQTSPEASPFESSTSGGDFDFLEVLHGSGGVPTVVNLSKRDDCERMTSDQLRQLALKLQAHPHVTVLNLSGQDIGLDMLHELVGPIALQTSLRELYLASACACSCASSILWAASGCWS